jgi:N-methylhydantoinase B
LPAETAELLFPVRYNSYEMVTDSAGPGQHRGGCGVRLEVEFLGRGQIITMETSRTREGSPGVNGGGRASRQRQLRRKDDGSLETIGGLDESTGEWLPQMLGNVSFQSGESFLFDSGGGGGWGDPLKRDPELVRSDVRDGLVSREQAAEAYGVVLTDSLGIDRTATEERRRKP